MKEKIIHKSHSLRFSELIKNPIVFSQHPTENELYEAFQALPSNLKHEFSQIHTELVQLLSKTAILLPSRHIYPQIKNKEGKVLNLYNPYGKYSLKLYVLGAWRRIDVDDRIMVDENDKKTLPWLKSNELWLPLICKGLLKIASFR